MTCAKKIVTCVILTEDYDAFIGRNDCNNAQAKCPRLPGECYMKCRTICDQPAHAEIIALEKAGVKAQGATAFLHGIDHYCKDCQQALVKAGVTTLRFV